MYICIEAPSASLSNAIFLSLRIPNNLILLANHQLKGYSQKDSEQTKPFLALQIIINGLWKYVWRN